MRKIFDSILRYPHKTFWIAMLPVFVLGYLFSVRSIDIQIHDTYLVVSLASLGLFLAIYLLISGMLYYLFRNKRLDANLIVIHIISIIFILIIWFWCSEVQHISTPDSFLTFRKVMDFAILSTMIFLCLQLLFLVNLTISYFRK